MKTKPKPIRRAKHGVRTRYRPCSKGCVNERIEEFQNPEKQRVHAIGFHTEFPDDDDWNDD